MSTNMFSAGDNVHVVNGYQSVHELPVEELPLPPNFVWGAATAAYQVEGGASQDGKGKSIWDTFTHLKPSRTNGENADVTCDHYNHMPEDVELMASYGMDTYRFSIAWSRIIPLGGRMDPINEKGIAFYGDLINRLRARDIEPVVTLFHWDTPQGIYDRYGAFLNTAEFKADFEHFARLCFSRFGDRVKQWITFNEPYIISIFGHHSGVLAPGRNTANGGNSKIEPWRVGHTIILSHAAVIQMYGAEFQPLQQGTISIALNGHFYEPWDAASEIHRAAAQRRLEFYIGWFADPIFLGKNYPVSMRNHLGSRLPEFTADDLELLRQSAPINAFYGMNHYSTKYARALPDPPAEDDCTGNVEEGPVNKEGQEIGPVSGMSWLRVAPNGFRNLLNWVWDRYRIPIIVTENGCPCPGESQMSLEQALDDKFRTRYIGLYLDAISRAIYEDGVKIQGYYVWSLMDNFGRHTFSFISPHYSLVGYLGLTFVHHRMVSWIWPTVRNHACRLQYRHTDTKVFGILHAENF
jgi:beta-glucosidase